LQEKKVARRCGSSWLVIVRRGVGQSKGTGSQLPRYHEEEQGPEDSSCRLSF
jgi:hypothetical protein